MGKFSVGDHISFKNHEHTSMWMVSSNAGTVRQVMQSYRHLDEEMVIAAFGEKLVYVTAENLISTSPKA